MLRHGLCADTASNQLYNMLRVAATAQDQLCLMCTKADAQLSEVDAPLGAVALFTQEVFKLTVRLTYTHCFHILSAFHIHSVFH